MLVSMELCKAHCYRQLDTKYYSDALAIYTRILSGSPDDIGALEVNGDIRTRFCSESRRFLSPSFLYARVQA